MKKLLIVALLFGGAYFAFAKKKETDEEDDSINFIPEQDEIGSKADILNQEKNPPIFYLEPQ